MIGKRMNGRRSNMKGQKRLLVNPFDGMAKRDTNQDRRRIARALTEDELTRLLRTARERPIVAAETVRRGPNKGKRLIVLTQERRSKLERLGAERALIYKTAILTGLRKGELRSLSVSDLSFGDVPFLKLRHHKEKVTVHGLKSMFEDSTVSGRIVVHEHGKRMSGLRTMGATLQ